jgi:PPM family protein phosphatase
MTSQGFEKGYHDNDHLAIAYISEKRAGKRIKEDTFCLLDSNIKIVRQKGKGFIFAVMDGMGGQKGGFAASSFVQSRLPAYYRQPGYCGEEGIALLLQDMFEEMRHQKKTDIMPETAGTTLSLLYMNDRKMHAFNIGDSAIYRFCDHTLALHPIFSTHRQDGLVSNYFGSDTLSYEGNTSPQSEGDVYLLCSDGLIESMDDAAMEHIIKQNRSAGVEKIAHELYLFSRQQGSKDDLTLIVIELIELL